MRAVDAKSSVAVPMSALGQKQTSPPEISMSALPPKADIVRTDKLAFVVGSSHPKCDFADEPLGAPVKATFPF